MALADKMIKTLMEKLDCDEETAKEIMETDRRIDKGEKLFELPKELEEGAKKARNAGNCKGYTKTANPNKGKLINDLLDGIPYVEELKILNREREFEFVYKGKRYKVVMSCPRS